VWNAQNRFTGWTDVPLSPQGQMEAQRAGEKLRAHGLKFDVVFTSFLHRAVQTAEMVLDGLDGPRPPVEQAWQLNERHYGALQGLNKAEAAAQLGQRRVTAWRRSFDGRPPALEWDDRRHPRFDPRYATLPPSDLPRGESLHDTLNRLLPYWHAAIAPALRSRQRVLLVGHGNTIRPLIKYLEAIPDHQTPLITIATGAPRMYLFNLDLISYRHYDIT
jgi:2,3-bisphosphoglycerate-dependent phosphoglycerate mutase